MKSKLLPVIFFMSFISLGFLFSKKENSFPVVKKIFADAALSDEGDDAASRYQWELMRLADPATGKIPDHIRAGELAFAKNLPVLSSFAPSNSRLTGNFIHRGPWNLGGRTRALAIDVTNESIVFAGSVNGGLYRSADGGLTWTNNLITSTYGIWGDPCLVVDTTGDFYYFHRVDVAAAKFLAFAAGIFNRPTWRCWRCYGAVNFASPYGICGAARCDCLVRYDYS